MINFHPTVKGTYEASLPQSRSKYVISYKDHDGIVQTRDAFSDDEAMNIEDWIEEEGFEHLESWEMWI